MSDFSLIEPKNIPAWTAAGFALALMAVVIALVGLYRINQTVLGTQVQVLMLNKKIEDHAKAGNGTAAPAVAPAAVPAPKIAAK